MGTKKSTRKFEKNHLKDTIERRKDFKKIKQRNQVKDKKKARNAKERAVEASNRDDDKVDGEVQSNDAQRGFDDMTVDEFFQGGFEIPEIQSKMKGKGKIEGSAVNGRKRKRPDDRLEESGGTEISPESGEEEHGSGDIWSDSDEELDGVGAHEEDLKALAGKDPEFYKFLQENDAELLEFGENGDTSKPTKSKKAQKPDKVKPSQKSADEEVEVEDSDGPEEDLVGATDDTEINPAMVTKWKTAMVDQFSLRSTKEVVIAFRASAHVDEDEGKAYKYSISSPEAYHELLLVALQQVPKVLNRHLPVQQTASRKTRVPTESKKFRTLTPLLKSYASSLQHLLTTLSDAPTLGLTLTSVNEVLPYILSFKKILKALIKTIVDIWSDSSSTEASRINAFLAMRRLAVIGDSGLRESVLKATYQGLIKGSRNTTIHTLQGINLMKNSAAELWSIDPVVGYTTGFSFIRQLAIHLRGSITNNSKESYKIVYNWQYVHSLDFWSRVLSSHCDTLKEAEAGKSSPLRPLIYPVVQVTLGAMRLIPTAQYFPLRFQLIRSLLRLSLSTDTYIPLAPLLLEVLHSAEMKKSPKPSTIKSLDFSTSIRAPKSYLRTRIYQDGVGEQVVELVAEFFVLWAKSIAFSELALPVIVMAKRWLKEASEKNSGNKNGKVNSSLVLLVQKLEANSRWIEDRRAKVDFAPNDRAGVDGFLRDTEWQKTPLGAFVVGQRKTREEKAKMLEEARRAEDRKRRADREKAIHDSDDEDDSMGDVDLDSDKDTDDG